MALFCNMMDISAYNAFVIYSEIKPIWNQRKKYKRRIFLEELSKSLVKEEIIRRKRVPQGNNAVNLVKSLQPSPSAAKRGRCYICKNDTKYSTKCDKCMRFLCSEHSKIIKKCNNCN